MTTATRGCMAGQRIRSAAVRVLIVSTFVEPRVGGVEQFTGWLARRLRARGHEARVLAGEMPGADADAVVPLRLLAASEWPLVLPGRRTASALRAELRRADALVIQGFAHPLCLWAAIGARLARVPARSVVHTDQPPSYGSAAYRAVAGAYDRSAARLTLRLAPPVSVSVASAA